MTIPNTGGVGRIPDWNKVTRGDGKPLSKEDERRLRARRAEARGDRLSTPLDQAEQARQRAEHAAAVAEVALEQAQEAQAALEQVRRERDALLAQEEARRAVRQSESPFRPQSSSGGADPYSGDLRHHPEAMAALAEGGFHAFQEVLSRLTEARRLEKADRTEQDRTMWRTGRGQEVTDDYRVPAQTSRPWYGS